MNQMGAKGVKSVLFPIQPSQKLPISRAPGPIFSYFTELAIILLETFTCSGLLNLLNEGVAIYVLLMVP